MPIKLVMLTVPGLRKDDLRHMPEASRHFSSGTSCQIRHSFPSVTWPAQATMLTGKLPNEHGVIANGFFWRDSQGVEMWTAPNSVIEQPQIWDLLHQRDTGLKSAAWFPMLSKKSGADYVVMPAPIHKPDGSEELWCYTKPQDFYGELLGQFGHFPLQHFWGPLANIKSTDWICQSAVAASTKFQPDFFYIYLPHLDYAAQKFGPDSPQAINAVQELDRVLAALFAGLQSAYADDELKWVMASEYVIQNVNHVTFPNRMLRDAGLLHVKIDADGRELIDFESSQAWALVDHQFSHVFVKHAEPRVIEKVVEIFAGVPGIGSVLSGEGRKSISMDHERSGEVILISEPHSWQAYYWWRDDALAPLFARTVDIHRKPGYDPVELFVDMTTKSIPLDANLVRGSHGVVTESTISQTIFATRGCSQELPALLDDTKICEWILGEFPTA